MIEMSELEGVDLGPLPDEVAVTKAFSERLPSQRVIDVATKAESTDFQSLVSFQPFRIIAFRALLRDFPLRDPTSLWMHAYDVEVVVSEPDPTLPASTKLEPLSVDSGA
jgi:hypothetical protein